MPDPTTLTTLNLNREIAHVQSVIEREIEATRQLLEARLDALDRANMVQALDHSRRLDQTERWETQSREAHAGFLTAERFEITASEWSLWRAAVDRHIAGTLVSREDFEAMVARQEQLVSRAEIALIERVKMAMDAHAALHVAHDESHKVMHSQTDLALQRAELTMRETASLHATAHEREHTMTKEADLKSEQSANVRFDLLTTAMVRVDTDRAVFVSRAEVTDKLDALVGRIDVLDKQSALYGDRMALSSANSTRLDILEKEAALLRGRDHGIGLSWGALVGAIGLTAVVVGLLTRFF